MCLHSRCGRREDAASKAACPNLLELHSPACIANAALPRIRRIAGHDRCDRGGHRRFFDPKFWRVILVDQRGCGASTPRGRLEARCPDNIL